VGGSYFGLFDQPYSDHLRLVSDCVPAELERQEAGISWQGTCASTRRMGGLFSSCATEHDEDFDAADIDRSNTMSKKELAGFIDKHAQLYETLALNLDMDRETCKAIATEVAFKLARCGDNATDLTKPQFVEFKKKYILDPKGNQSFVFRTVFRAYDKDGNGYLDSEELDGFVDLFFKADSFVRKDDPRLKDMSGDDLKKLITEKCDTDKVDRCCYSGKSRC
jgi:hypothetical protein